METIILYSIETFALGKVIVLSKDLIKNRKQLKRKYLI